MQMVFVVPGQDDPSIISIHGSLNGISEWLILRIPSRIRWVTSSEGSFSDAVGHQHSVLTAAAKGRSDLVTGIV